MQNTEPPLENMAARRHYGTLVVAVMLGLTFSAAPTAVAAAVKGAYVEAILPSKPYKISVDALSPSVPGVQADELVFAAGDGAVGITSITVTNNDSFAKSLTVSEPPSGSGHACGTPVSTTASSFVIRVPGTSTVHLAFPSPLVFSAVNGHTCFGLHINEFAAGVQVLLTGFRSQP